MILGSQASGPARVRALSRSVLDTPTSCTSVGGPASTCYGAPRVAGGDGDMQAELGGCARSCLAWFLAAIIGHRLVPSGILTGSRSQSGWITILLRRRTYMEPPVNGGEAE